MEEVLGSCALILTVLMLLGIIAWLCCSMAESIVRMRRRRKKVRYNALLRENERLRSFLADAAKENSRLRKAYYAEIVRRGRSESISRTIA